MREDTGKVNTYVIIDVEFNMGVKIKIPAMFQSSTGGVKVAEVSGATVGECLKQLATIFPAIRKMFFDEADSFSGYLNVSLNGKNIQGDFNQIPVRPGDEIYPMILIEGG